MASWSNLVFSLKSLLISTAVLSIAVVMKFSVPLIVEFAVYEVPVVWSTLISWLKPPYLYVIVNGIIITIAASSRFHQMLDDDNQSEPLVKSEASPSDFVPASAPPEFGIVELPAVCESEPPRVLEVNPAVVNGGDEDEYVISRSTWTPPQSINYLETQTEYIFPATEKPLVSSRFGHRKPVKASPEGGSKALRVAKPKRHETLENTWKTITDGRHVPLTRHLRKSETWENHGRQMKESPQKVTKSETFRDRTNYDPAASPSSGSGSGKLRKEASLSQDELNRRVEAFIKKFNAEMRLQRQESLNQYKKMVGVNH